MLAFVRNYGWVLLVAGGLAAAIVLLAGPAPPREITLATGQPGGAYHEFGTRLAAELEREGLKVTLRATQGSVENLRLLESAHEDVALAFVQSGIREDGESELRALASLFHEPVWLFTRFDRRMETVRELAGKRVAVGAAGSGTLPVALRVLEVNGLLAGDEGGRAQAVQLGAREAAAALRTGTVDAAFFVGAPQGELIRGLLADRSLDFHGLHRGLAYQAAFPRLTTLVVGEGQLDLEENIPPEDRTVLSAEVTLVANGRFHPGLTPLILDTAARILRDGGPLERPGEFPASRPTDFPLLAEAEHFHKYGPPFLMRYLPFWAAIVVFRVFILVVPLAAVLIPLIRVAPPLYQWRTRRRIFRWYSHLREIDQRLHSGAINETVDRDLERLYELQDEILAVKVPLSYADELYDLHLHIEWVIRRLQRFKSADAPAG